MSDGKFIRALNALYDWSLQSEGLGKLICERHFADHIAWKIPFSGLYTAEDPNLRAIRAFCVERLILKISHLKSYSNVIQEEFDMVRFYVIIPEPNIFMSEIGIIFSENKWNSLLYRSIKTPNFSEKTEETSRTLFEAFGVQKPLEFSHVHVSHLIEDRDEEIYFFGGLHALWIDHLASESVS